MKIVILGPAHPYRGGLARIMERMAKEFTAMGDSVRISTFSLQYPSLLFPGKTQMDTDPAPEGLDIRREVNTCNPFNWIRVGRRLKREKPDLIVMKYWTPFMAPCFGTIARIARKNGCTRTVCQIDNVNPHERHITDRIFNRYFLRSVYGFVYMSESVNSELKQYTDAPALFSPHPMFDNFGERTGREVACRSLGIDPACKYVMFFGLIRDYKGLDILLDAFREVKVDGLKLIVAGEFYDDREKYIPAIEALGDRVVLRDGFVPDSEVRYYFSAVDAVVLPYRTATQSGVTQIAYNFSVPIVVTSVGGLKEIVPDSRVGFVCEPDAGSVASAVTRLYEDGNLDRFRENMAEERKRFSWTEMCLRLKEISGIL